MASTKKPIHQSAERTSPPALVKPQLAALVKKAPDGPEWLHEIKLDGYRMHARLDAGRVRILTRRGNDWTEKYPAIANAIAGLPAHDAYLDGELCGVLPDGGTAFNLPGAADPDCRESFRAVKDGGRRAVEPAAPPPIIARAQAW
jgi:ATP-dependent DNA ligase